VAERVDSRKKLSNAKSSLLNAWAVNCGSRDGRSAAMEIGVKVVVLEWQFTVIDNRAGQLYTHKGAYIAVVRSIAGPFVGEMRLRLS
jgi:hypothetical protein